MAEDAAIERKKCKVIVLRDREKESRSTYICGMEGKKPLYFTGNLDYFMLLFIPRQPDQCWCRLNQSLIGGSKKKSEFLI